MEAPQTYADFYTANQARAGNSRQVLATFAADNGLTAEWLLGAAHDNLDELVAFVGLGTDGRTFVVHRLAKVPTRLGQEGGQYDDRFLATFQDVLEHNLSTVEVDAALFGVIATPTVPLTATVVATAGNNPRPALLGPYVAGQEGTSDARSVRPLCAVPARFVPLLLRRRLKPWELWDEVAGAIRNAGMEADCAVLIQWICAALTARPQDPGVSIVSRPLPSAVLAPDPRVHQLRTNILRRDLPARFAPAAAVPLPPAVADQTVAVLEGLRQDLAERAIRNDADKAAKKTPSGRWKFSIDFLYKFCRSNNDAALPAVWAELSQASGQKSDRSVLQHAVDARAREAVQLGRPHCRLIVSPQLAKDIIGLHWAAEHADQLDRGLSIFQAFQGQGQHRAKLATAAQLYDNIEAGQNGSYDDAIRLHAQHRPQLPSSLLELRTSLIGWLNLLEVLLGVRHPLSRSVSMAATELLANEARIHELFYNAPSRYCRFGLSVHYRVHEWMLRQDREVEAVQVPVLDSLIQSILHHSWMPPELPQEYHDLFLAQHQPAPATTPLATGGQLPQPPVSTSPPAAPGPTQAAGQTDSVIVHNSTPSPGITFDRNFNVRALLAQRRENNVPQPRFGGVHVCVSYHKKGYCYSNCARRATHRALVEAEVAELKAFLGDSA